MKEKAWKILLIDDDPGIRKILALTLEDLGYEVLTASDGKSGIDLCERESPRIVITGIHMPGISGIEVVKRVKEKDPNKEVIVITAFSEVESAVHALQLDASDFVIKPISEDALLVALKRAKERFTTRKELADYTALLEEKWMQTAEELAKTFNFQKMLIESSIDAVIACDHEGIVVVCNRAMEQILDLAREEVIAKRSLDSIFAPGENQKFQLKLASEEFGGVGRLVLFETVLLGSSGAKVPCQVSASVLQQDGQEVGLVCFFRDLREIRRLTQQYEDQARMLHQDKMISLGRLAASVVHEINNPIAGVLNYARLMKKIAERGDLNDERIHKFRNYLGLMESELDRCSRIVSNLLAFSRKSKLEFREVNINDLISRSITLSEHRLTLQNIKLEIHLSALGPKVTGDFNQLQQCIINLIFNSIDAMPTGGRLKIESHADTSRQIVEIHVADSGCGISGEDLPYIFDPFYTTKMESKGLGLGLSTVYGILDRHKGTIGVKTSPGDGSVFTISLPMKV